MSGVKIKLCGMFRECDIDYVNEALPDYIGFILNFPKSHRNLSLSEAEKLKKRLSPKIKAVGVFVDSPPEYCVEAVRRGIADVIQLHGSENADHIRAIRASAKVEIIKALKVTPDTDLSVASGADYLLLDNGTGTGRSFDHSLIDRRAIRTPFFLAGGLTPENLAEAAKRLSPYAVDLSSGIETDGVKDRAKIISAVRAIREL